VIIWQDIVLAIGGMVGLLSKMYAAADPQTVWSRWASIPNAILYIPTTVAFATLGLWVTTLTAAMSCLTWFAIGIFRAPKSDKDA